MHTIALIIPAYNEQNRIQRTLQAYASYFSDSVTLIVVLNGCTDNTALVVREEQKKYPQIKLIESAKAGKGIAIKVGFLEALKHHYDLIGFVDADMATQPRYFDELIKSINNYDGVIASRYMQGAKVYPPRPFIKEWGRILFYNSLIRLLFGLKYKDFQCGAKLFTRQAIALIAPQLTIDQWVFDVELLYLCKRNHLTIKEIPTVWYDQDESKLRVMSSGLRMLISVIQLRFAYMFKKKDKQ